MITAITLGVLTAIPVIGWWAAYDDAKSQRAKAELAAHTISGLEQSNKTLRERLVIAEQQVDWHRSRETHPSFRRVK